MPAHMVSDGVSGLQRSLRKEPSEAFRFIVNRHDKVLEYQFSIARWIMASLLVLNAGAMLGILNAIDKAPQALANGGVFLWGAVAAVGSGICAWVNCNLITIAADYRLDWDSLENKSSPLSDNLEAAAWVLGIASVVLAVISLVFFVAGAIEVRHALAAAGLYKR